MPEPVTTAELLLKQAVDLLGEINGKLQQGPGGPTTPAAAPTARPRKTAAKGRQQVDGL